VSSYEDAAERNTSIVELWRYRVFQSQSNYPKDEYGYNLEIMGINDGLGDIRWQIVCILLFIWVTICIVSRKRIYASPAFVWITSVLLCICMIAILVRSLLFPGAKEGLLNLVTTTDWKVLFYHRACNAASLQMFNLNSVGHGIYPALTTHNKIKYNSINDIALSLLVQIVANIASTLNILFDCWIYVFHLSH
jgi:SNF family Na+-dependent transporter